MKAIKWGDVEWVGTGLRGYLDNVPWSFEETVARLKTLSGQEPGDRADRDKTSVEFNGTFGGKVFTLYDYKGDRTIHIGGNGDLDVASLRDALRRALDGVRPSAYEAEVPRYYGGRQVHQWKEEG